MHDARPDVSASARATPRDTARSVYTAATVGHATSFVETARSRTSVGCGGPRARCSIPLVPAEVRFRSRGSSIARAAETIVAIGDDLQAFVESRRRRFVLLAGLSVMLNVLSAYAILHAKVATWRCETTRAGLQLRRPR